MAQTFLLIVSKHILKSIVVCAWCNEKNNTNKNMTNTFWATYLSPSIKPILTMSPTSREGDSSKRVAWKKPQVTSDKLLDSPYKLPYILLKQSENLALH